MQRKHGRVDLAPRHNPLRQIRKRRTHEVLQQIELDERRQRRCRHIQQHHEDECPADRVAGLTHRRRGVKAREDVRQARRANHQAKHQQHEVQPLGAALVFRRRREWFGGWRPYTAARQRVFALLVPEDRRGGRIGRKLFALALQRLDLAQWRIAFACKLELRIQRFAGMVERLRQLRDTLLQPLSFVQEVVTHVLLGRVMRDAPLLFLDLHQQAARRKLRHRIVIPMPADDRHHAQKGHDHDDVLRDLGPRHGAHTAQERAHQNARQPEEHAHRKLDADKARDHQPHTLDLRDEVDERTQRRPQHRNATHDRTAAAFSVAVAVGEKIRHRVAAKFAQVRRQQESDEAVAARPAHHIGETFIARGEHDARQADEGCRAHPVSRGGHAVEERRHTAPCHVVLGQIGRAADQPDARIDGNRDEQKHVAEPHAGPAHVLDRAHHHDEEQQPYGIEPVIQKQPLAEAAVLLRVGGQDWRPALAVSAFPSVDRGWLGSQAWTCPA